MVCKKKLSILEGENTSLKKELDELESSSNEHVNQLTTDNSELKSKLEELTIKNDQDNGNMKGKILTMASKVSKLEDDLDTSAANELSDALLLSGATIPLETPTENSKQIVIDLLRDHVKINLQDQDILSANRVGPKIKNGQTMVRKIKI